MLSVIYTVLVADTGTRTLDTLFSYQLEENEVVALKLIQI